MRRCGPISRSATIQSSVLWTLCAGPTLRLISLPLQRSTVMARFVTRFALGIIASAVCIATASQMPAEESKPVSFALFAPGQSEKTISALTELFTRDNKNASVSLVKNLPDAIASKADIVVLALSVKEFNSLGPYDADALKKRKVIGISYG